MTSGSLIAVPVVALLGPVVANGSVLRNKNCDLLEKLNIQILEDALTVEFPACT
jgi:hypothetical protein